MASVSPDNVYTNGVQARAFAARQVERMARELRLLPTSSAIPLGAEELTRFYDLETAYSPRDRLAVASRFCAAYLPILVQSILEKLVLTENDNVPDPRAVDYGYGPLKGPVVEDLMVRLSVLCKLASDCRPCVRRYLFEWRCGTNGIGTIRVAYWVLKRVIWISTMSAETPDLPMPIFPPGMKEWTTRQNSIWVLEVGDVFTCLAEQLPSTLRMQVLPGIVRKDLPLMEKLLRTFPKQQGEPEEDLGTRAENLLRDLQGYAHLGTETLVDERDTYVAEGCWRWGCSKTMHDCKLFQCGRCRSVLYCSKAHQREDWADEELPHQAWCYKMPWMV